jgi:hypothetical protein
VIRFLIDPQHVRDALLTGKCLMVEINGPHRKVTVISRKDYPNVTPSNESGGRVGA